MFRVLDGDDRGEEEEVVNEEEKGRDIMEVTVMGNYGSGC